MSAESTPPEEAPLRRLSAAVLLVLLADIGLLALLGWAAS
jgi:hypothetical protein